MSYFLLYSATLAILLHILHGMPTFYNLNLSLEMLFLHSELPNPFAIFLMYCKVRSSVVGHVLSVGFVDWTVVLLLCFLELGIDIRNRFCNFLSCSSLFDSLMYLAIKVLVMLVFEAIHNKLLGPLPASEDYTHKMPNEILGKQTDEIADHRQHIFLYL